MIVCLSQLVPPNKVQAIRELGAEVVIVGHSQDDAQLEAERIARTQGAAFIPPFDHPHIIAGQGTLGLEILEQCPEVAEVLVPLSGGGCSLASRWASNTSAQRSAPTASACAEVRRCTRALRPVTQWR